MHVLLHLEINFLWLLLYYLFFVLKDNKICLMNECILYFAQHKPSNQFTDIPYFTQNKMKKDLEKQQDIWTSYQYYIGNVNLNSLQKMSGVWCRSHK